MTATAVTIAKGVAEKLNAANLTPKFCAERSYADWNHELNDDRLRVDIVVRIAEQTADIETRGDMAMEVPIAIAVRKKFTNAQSNEDTGRIRVAEIDELIELVEKIWWELRPQNLEDFNPGEWIETKILVNPDTATLKNKGQFLGIVKVTFRHTKEA